MQKIAISEFKAHALKVLAKVAESKEPVIITKRGRPLVQVTPIVNTDRQNVPGKLSKLLVFENDIVTPLGEAVWNACQ